MKSFARILAALLLGVAAFAHAQTYQPLSGGGSLISAQQTGTSVSNAGTTNILSLTTTGIRRIMVVCTVATQALSAFQIQAQPQRAPAQQTLYSVAGDYTTPKGILIGASGDLTTIAAAGTGWFIMDTVGIDLVNVRATAATGTATVSCYASGAN